MDEDKRELRRARWQALRELGAARFPGAVGRIPNFTGAELAAERLAEQASWKRAKVLKCNPDLPQRPVRRRALAEGKRLYMAVPKLAERRAFVLLDPAKLDPCQWWHASSIKGAFELGRPVTLKQMEPIDLVVTGCVAVSADGARLGKGGGYSDLEYALLREAERITARTPIWSTVHATQVVPPGVVPMRAHDVSLDGFATADEWVRCRRRARRPAGVLWDLLTEERRAAIPLLARGPGAFTRGPSTPRRG